MSDMGSSGFFCVISVVIYTYFLYINSYQNGACALRSFCGHKEACP